MRRTMSTILSVAALALPVADGWAAADANAAAKATPKKKVVTRKFAGPAVQADRWGTVQVTIVVRKTTTTTGTKKKVTRKITSVNSTYPDHTDRSVFINQQALPILYQETLQAQSASIDLVSGATDLSQAFVQSLQAAILKAKAA
jgi:uncharacterized protein with FMN-binding domain